MKFVLHVMLVNSPDAVAKMMLLVKQGNLMIRSVNLYSMGDGKTLSALMMLEGEENKGEWLAKKLLNFPYFHAADLMKTSA